MILVVVCGGPLYDARLRVNPNYILTASLRPFRVQWNTTRLNDDRMYVHACTVGIYPNLRATYIIFKVQLTHMGAVGVFQSNPFEFY